MQTYKSYNTRETMSVIQIKPANNEHLLNHEKSGYPFSSTVNEVGGPIKKAVSMPTSETMHLRYFSVKQPSGPADLERQAIAHEIPLGSFDNHALPPLKASLRPPFDGISRETDGDIYIYI